MKKVKRKIKYKDLKDFLKVLEKRIAKRATNNYKKMHKKPMRRKGGVY